MSIKLHRNNGLYSAELTPPHIKFGIWKTACPMSRAELIDILFKQGCYQQDIGDALHEIDRVLNGDNSIILD